MKKGRPESPFALIVIGMVILSMWMAACCTLQHQKGFSHYPKNEVWRSDKK